MRSIRSFCMATGVRGRSFESRGAFEILLASLFVGEFLRAFGQPDEIGYRLGRLLFEQPDHDVSLRSLKNGVRSCRSAHALSLHAKIIVHEPDSGTPLTSLSACATP